MSIVNYKGLKKRVEEAQKLIDELKQKSEVEPINAKLSEMHLKVALNGDDRWSSTLNKYITRAAGEMMGDIVNKAQEMMMKDLSELALLAQDECV